MNSGESAEVSRLSQVGRLAVILQQVVIVVAKSARSRGRELMFDELRAAFVRLGPTYIKLGQLIASSPGAFWERLSVRLRPLLDNVPPESFETICAVLNGEFGAHADRVFAHIDRRPIASASLAQVHRAVLRTGEPVVVKVQRPGLLPRIAADLCLLRRLARLLRRSRIARAVNLEGIVGEMAAQFRDELDFRQEALSMQRWSERIKSRPIGQRVRTPSVFWEHTTSRVLTMEWVEGIQVDDVAGLHRAGIDGTQVVKTIAYSMFESTFRIGLLHGDLHAGNLLVDSDGRVVFLDFGIVGQLSDAARSAISRMVCALIPAGDFAAAARALATLGAFDSPHVVELLAEDIRRVLVPLGAADLGAVSYGRLARELLLLAEKYNAHLPRDLILIGKQFLYVERYMKLLAPGWKVVTDLDLLCYFGGLLKELRLAESPPTSIPCRKLTLPT